MSSTLEIEVYVSTSAYTFTLSYQTLIRCETNGMNPVTDHLHAILPWYIHPSLVTGLGICYFSVFTMGGCVLTDMGSLGVWPSGGRQRHYGCWDISSDCESWLITVALTFSSRGSGSFFMPCGQWTGGRKRLRLSPLFLKTMYRRCERPGVYPKNQLYRSLLCCIGTQGFFLNKF